MDTVQDVACSCVLLVDVVKSQLLQSSGHRIPSLVGSVTWTMQTFPPFSSRAWSVWTISAFERVRVDSLHLAV